MIIPLLEGFIVRLFGRFVERFRRGSFRLGFRRGIFSVGDAVASLGIFSVLGVQFAFRASFGGIRISFPWRSCLHWTLEAKTAAIFVNHAPAAGPTQGHLRPPVVRNILLQRIARMLNLGVACITRRASVIGGRVLGNVSVALQELRVATDLQCPQGLCCVSLTLHDVLLASSVLGSAFSLQSSRKIQARSIEVGVSSPLQMSTGNEPTRDDVVVLMGAQVEVLQTYDREGLALTFVDLQLQPAETFLRNSQFVLLIQLLQHFSNIESAAIEGLQTSETNRGLPGSSGFQ
eukprot:RCo000574